MGITSKDKFNNDKDIQREIKNTEIKKHKFIEDIKNGLGEQIKKNKDAFTKPAKPNKTTIQKILETIRVFFKTF
jgi:hypothetical protein